MSKGTQWRRRKKGSRERTDLGERTGGSKRGGTGFGDGTVDGAGAGRGRAAAHSRGPAAQVAVTHREGEEREWAAPGGREGGWAWSVGGGGSSGDFPVRDGGRGTEDVHEGEGSGRGGRFFFSVRATKFSEANVCIGFLFEW